MDAIGSLLPLGVAVALGLTPLLALIIVLLSRRRTVNGIGFVAGSAFAIAGLAAAATGFALSIPQGPDAGENPALGVMRVLLGLTLIVLGGVTWMQRSRSTSGRLERMMGRIEQLRPGHAVLVGAAFSIVNVKNLAIVVVAGTLLAGAESPTAMLAEGSLFVAVSCSVMAVIVVAACFFPRGAARALDRLRRVLLAHGAGIMTVVFLLAGVAMIGSGIDGH
ncbi:GAP family protein [Microbacterium sp. NPDC089698]|uniref:GAP family protein n=1 Tax=Microbacterium sp. NPDC089698 TaxID=3364200 RepID=UPI00380FA714